MQKGKKVNFMPINYVTNVHVARIEDEGEETQRKMNK